MGVFGSGKTITVKTDDGRTLVLPEEVVSQFASLSQPGSQSAPGRDPWLPGNARPTIPQVVDKAARPYTTVLTPNEENKFQDWVKTSKVPFDPSPQADYDMRGFWLAAHNGDPRAKAAPHPVDGKAHFPDAWMTPHHPQFNDSTSIYALSGAEPRNTPAEPVIAEPIAIGGAAPGADMGGQ